MALETGWGDGTARNDTVLRTALLGHVDVFEHVTRARGGRVWREPGLALADAGSPSFFFNTAVVLQPPGDAGFNRILDRVEEFFGSRPGGGVLVFSPWPVPPVARPHWELLGHPPVMVRPGAAAGPGGAAGPAGRAGLTRRSGFGPPPVPGDLRIDEVADDELLSAFEAVLIDGFPMEELQPPYPGCLLDGRVLERGGLHCWLGSVGGRPVAASAAYFADDVVIVAWVATLAEFRGRGYGLAITWAAVREAPHLPAALLASDPGRPVYERLGFLPLVRLTALRMNERLRPS